MICALCKCDYPVGLINDMALSGPGLPQGVTYVRMCPCCALHTRNEIAGLPEGTPFQGMQAQAMLEAAVTHLKRTKQTWTKPA